MEVLQKSKSSKVTPLSVGAFGIRKSQLLKGERVYTELCKLWKRLRK